jgi:peroxiredoxin
MKELGELEANHSKFEDRGTQIVVVSMEGPDKARATQAEFPHLKVLADSDASVAGALKTVHKHAAPDGSDTNAPTTVLVDGKGVVRWFFRPDFHIVRLSPAQLLGAIDEHLPRREARASRN